MYFSGQGKVFLAKRDANGNPLGMRYVGKTANGLKLGLQTTTQKRKEAETGQRLTALRRVTEKDASISFELEDFSKENLAMALWGESATIAAGTVTGEALPPGLAVGEFFRLALPNVSSVVITDSSGTPKTLTQDTNYRVSNAKLGAGEVLDLTTGGPFVEPFMASYANGLAYNIPMFGVVPGEWFFRFEGLNTEDSNEPVLVELYKVSLDPLKELLLKGEDITTMAIEGGALYDETKAESANLGWFGQIITLK